MLTHPTLDMSLSCVSHHFLCIKYNKNVLIPICESVAKGDSNFNIIIIYVINKIDLHQCNVTGLKTLKNIHSCSFIKT